MLPNTWGKEMNNYQIPLKTKLKETQVRQMRQVRLERDVQEPSTG